MQALIKYKDQISTLIGINGYCYSFLSLLLHLLKNDAKTKQTNKTKKLELCTGGPWAESI